jgi:hypothetical protein
VSGPTAWALADRHERATREAQERAAREAAAVVDAPAPEPVIEKPFVVPEEYHATLRDAERVLSGFAWNGKPLFVPNAAADSVISALQTLLSDAIEAYAGIRRLAEALELGETGAHAMQIAARSLRAALASLERVGAGLPRLQADAAERAAARPAERAARKARVRAAEAERLRKKAELEQYESGISERPGVVSAATRRSDGLGGVRNEPRGGGASPSPFTATGIHHHEED